MRNHRSKADGRSRSHSDSAQTGAARKLDQTTANIKRRLCPTSQLCTLREAVGGFEEANNRIP